MVDLSAYLDQDVDAAPEGEAEDYKALKACFQALADAVASTNLAVIQNVQGDPAGATARVQASVGALKRFHEAFKILDGQSAAEDEGEGEDEG
jgi:hypothetical protein